MRKLALTTVLSAVLGGTVGTTAQADRSNYASAQRAICYYFGPYCSQAMRVAGCESGYSPWATNGQYLGLFQMGDSERRTYGHGNNVWAQAKAAYKYFVASGRDWSPWSCKP